MLRDLLASAAVLVLLPSFLVLVRGASFALQSTVVPLPLEVAPRALVQSQKPVRSCESLASVSLPSGVVNTATVDQGSDTLPASCRVTATVTHQPADDEIKIFVALPLANWNGRFLGTGGDGFSGGSEDSLRRPLTLGYAAAATNAGHDTWGASFILDDRGRLNWHSVRDYAQLGTHEMTKVGKVLTEAFYGTPPARSYFAGCSAGGRQAMMEAQRFPADYDGIYAGAPGINLPQVAIVRIWRETVMQEAATDVPMCKFAAATAAAVAACDMVDGVRDGVIESPLLCTFDPRSLIGAATNGCGTFTSADADVVAKVWEGPRRRDGSFLWHGPPRGADFGSILGLVNDETRVVPRPGRVDSEWFRFFLHQDPEWRLPPLTRARFEEYWDQSTEQFGTVLSAVNPDLSTFRDRGGKLIMWHGWADHSTPAQGSLDYYVRVQQRMGGADETAKFARLFLAPGAGHCGGGPGRIPDQRGDVLLKWIEDGVAPETLNAMNWSETHQQLIRRRPVCRYPLVARYKGQGSTEDGANFECRTGF